MKSTSSYHIPVLLPEVVDALAIIPTGLYLDLTVGGGSHSEAILTQLVAPGSLIAGDRDPDAVTEATRRLEAVHTSATWQVRQATFSEMTEYLTEQHLKPNGVLADLGVSSHQLDAAERGYSYHHDGPLDMRMDATQGLTAADIVNNASVDDLAAIFSRYGEERYANRIARHLVASRQEKPFTRTVELAEAIAYAMPKKAKQEAQHPARRVFQALRIAVNGELDEVNRLLEWLPDGVASGARIAIITFHSLEDRMVKQAMQTWQAPCTCPKALPCVCHKTPYGRVLNKGGIVAATAELKRNRRAKSARLRVFEMRKEQNDGTH